VIAGDDRLRSAHSESVKVALRELGCFAARRSKESLERLKRHEFIGEICAAIFEHDTSRSLDPQLHPHCVIANATWDKTRSGWSYVYGTVENGALAFLAANENGSTRFKEIQASVADDVFDFRGVKGPDRRIIGAGDLVGDHAIRHEVYESNIDLGWIAGQPIIYLTAGFQPVGGLSLCRR
jgi:hypothetical protein